MTCCDPDDEFGIVTCESDPDHCEHPSMDGVGDWWGCDICGHREPKPGRSSELATAPGPARVERDGVMPGGLDTGDDDG